MNAFTALLTLVLTMNLSTNKPAYRLYTAEGTATDYDKMIAAAAEADVVLFGELHNNPICHWLQAETAKSLHAVKGEDLILGGEMWETDNQLLIDEFMSGLISERNYESEARLWPNYQTDYKPFFEFGRTNGLRFVATNIPRRYASVMFKKGEQTLEDMDKDARRYIAPLPIPFDQNLPGYKALVDMNPHGGDGAVNFAKAQAVKDATMAYFITENMKRDKLFLHLNGDYHSANYEGISWYLNEYDDDLKVVTLSTVEADDVSKLPEDAKNRADFIIVVPASMTKTH